MPEVIVFAGPSLRWPLDDEWTARLDGAALWPPARRGDVLRALAERPRALLLIDGYYYTTPAVTHKELLYALAAGVTVVGAASMGALRAAELAPQGMVGVGWIFEQFRSGRLDGDDEVAVLHTPAEHGYRPLTVALAELRYAVAESGLGEAGNALIARLKALPFTRRSEAALAALARELLGESQALALLARLRSAGIKTRDTADALAVVSAAPRGRAAPALCFTHYVSYFCEKYLAPAARREQSSGEESRDLPLLVEAWHMARLFHPRAPAFVAALRHRFLLASAARAAALDPEPARCRACLESLADPGTLPLREVGEEAREIALAECALDFFGGAVEALDWLAEHWGLGRGEGRAALLERVSHQSDVLPGWNLLRAFAFSPAVEAALAAARAALEVSRCFTHWARGARILKEDLWQVAADIWRCRVDQVDGEAARRGLLATDGLSPGLREALQLVAPAERLPRPINDYRELRLHLLTTPLEHPADRTGWSLAAGSGGACQPASGSHLGQGEPRVEL